MSLSEAIHTSLIAILSSILATQENKTLLSKLKENDSHQQRIFSNDNKDNLVASYDRFMRTSPPCPASIERRFALTNTALRVFHAVMKPKIAALQTPPPSLRPSPSQN